VVRDVEIALVDGLNEQIDFIPQLGKFRMGALTGFDDRPGHALGVDLQKCPEAWRKKKPRLPIGLKEGGLRRKMPFHRRSGARFLKFAQKNLNA